MGAHRQYCRIRQQLGVPTVSGTVAVASAPTTSTVVGAPGMRRGRRGVGAAVCVISSCCSSSSSSSSALAPLSGSVALRELPQLIINLHPLQTKLFDLLVGQITSNVWGEKRKMIKKKKKDFANVCIGVRGGGEHFHFYTSCVPCAT